jgi:hypothetical protein
MEYTGNVRIGNWQEKKVVDALGRFDYKDRSTQVLTGARVIFHDDKVEPKDYASTQGSTYPDPKSFPSYSSVNPVGPRQKAMEARLKAQVDGEFAEAAAIKAEEANKRDLQSTARSAMAASGFVPQEEKEQESRFETRNADYATDTAVTYYTHTLENSKQGLNFPVTLVSNMKKPWAKVSQVSEGTRLSAYVIFYIFIKTKIYVPSVFVFIVNQIWVMALNEFARIGSTLSPCPLWGR